MPARLRGIGDAIADATDDSRQAQHPVRGDAAQVRLQQQINLLGGVVPRGQLRKRRHRRAFQLFYVYFHAMFPIRSDI